MSASHTHTPQAHPSAGTPPVAPPGRYAVECWWPATPKGATPPALPPLSWEPLPVADPRVFPVLPEIGWGISEHGALVLVAPFLNEHGLFYWNDTRSVIEILCRFNDMVFAPPHYERTFADPAVRSRIHSGQPTMPRPRYPAPWDELPPCTPATMLVWERIRSRLDAATVAAAESAPGGASRWYGRLLGRPDLADLVTAYPMVAPALKPEAIEAVSDPVTRRLPRRQSAPDVIRALIQSQSLLFQRLNKSLLRRPGAPLPTGNSRRHRMPDWQPFITQHGTAVLAGLPAGFFAWCRGPADCVERATLFRWADARGHVPRFFPNAVRMAHLLSADRMRRCTSARDWVALLGFSQTHESFRPLVDVYLNDPSAFATHVPLLAPAPTRAALGDLTGASTLATLDQVYELALRLGAYFREAYREYHEPLDAARSLRRVVAILRRAQQQAMARDLADRLAAAAQYPDPFPRPAWIPDDHEIPCLDAGGAPAGTLTWLPSAQALAAEGSTMAHCLGIESHILDALESRSAFFHGELDAHLLPDRRCSLELDLRSGVIIQAYGFEDATLPCAVHDALRATLDRAMGRAARRPPADTHSRWAPHDPFGF